MCRLVFFLLFLFFYCICTKQICFQGNRPMHHTPSVFRMQQQCVILSNSSPSPNSTLHCVLLRCGPVLSGSARAGTGLTAPAVRHSSCCCYQPAADAPTSPRFIMRCYYYNKLSLSLILNVCLLNLVQECNVHLSTTKNYIPVMHQYKNMLENQGKHISEYIMK